MTRKSIQKINFSFDQNGKSKSDEIKRSLPTIRCVCGRKILVVPDLKAMNKAINDHVAEHKKARGGSALDSLEEFLTEQVLIVASKIYLPNVN